MMLSLFDPGSTLVRPQKPWTSFFYDSMNSLNFKTMEKTQWYKKGYKSIFFLCLSFYYIFCISKYVVIQVWFDYGSGRMLFNLTLEVKECFFSLYTTRKCTFSDEKIRH